MSCKKTFNGCIALLVFSLTWLPGTGVAGKLYKWVDENGEVRYGDSIPPRYAGKSRDTLNNDGIVVHHKAAAKTPEQLANEARIKKAEAEKERIRKEKERQDQILLSTFTNEDEMVMTRDGKIQAIEAVIGITEGRIKKLEKRLGDLQQNAANMERAGKPVSKNLKNDIGVVLRQIDDNQRYIKNRKAAQQKIRDDFAADIKRFRELKSAQASAGDK